MLSLHVGLGALRLRLGAFIASLILIVGLAAPSAWGQGGTSDANAAAEAPLLVPPGQPEPPHRGPEDALARGTPRSAARGFLQAARDGDYEKAAEYLDLRRLAPSRRTEDGPALARKLKTILDKTLWVDLDSLSDDPEGQTDDGLPPRIDRVGTIDTAEGAVDVQLARVPREDGESIWKISADTVSKVPALQREFGTSPLVERLPPWLVETRLLELAAWQWIGLLAVLLFAAAAGWLVEVVFHRIVAVVSKKGDGALARVLDFTAGPLRLILALLIVTAAQPWLELTVPADQLLTAIEGTVWVVAFTWIALRVMDGLVARAQQQLVARGQPAASGLFPLLRRMGRFVILVIGLLFALHSFGVNVTALVAGLGVGGLAVALAAQKTLENLFGGITLVADAPVRVGDFCRFGDEVGTVEEIGMRSTRIRTLDRTLVSMPNAEFSTMKLENFAPRDRFLLKTVLGLRYETTPDQMRFLLTNLKHLLATHPDVSPDPARIRFVGFGASSLDLEIFAYIQTRDINTFYAIRESIFLRIMDLVEAAGTGFAFPSQTAYLAQDSGLDEERSRAAEAQVERWRANGEPPFPDIPAEGRVDLG